MIQKLITLKTLLGSKNLILTGSTALAYHGLLDMTEANDLDIVITSPTATETEILNRLQSESPSKKFVPGGVVNYSFLFEGVKVDVWTVDKHPDSEFLQTKDGVQVASIRSIVNAKLGYGRSKDWIQLMQLSKRIFDEDKFKKELPSISNHNEEYDA
jgi:hypothetical protein